MKKDKKLRLLLKKAGKIQDKIARLRAAGAKETRKSDGAKKAGKSKPAKRKTASASPSTPTAQAREEKKISAPLAPTS